MHSVVGEGSTFWFETPLNVVDAPVLTTATLYSEDTLAAARVLFVDDLATNRLLVKALLDDRVETLVTVDNGWAAIDALQAMQFDVVLMDVEMAGMDGLETTRRIRDLPVPIGNIPIIALTAHAMLEEIARCRAAGMDDVLSKPIDADLLESRIIEWSMVRMSH